MKCYGNETCKEITIALENKSLMNRKEHTHMLKGNHSIIIVLKRNHSCSRSKAMNLLHFDNSKGNIDESTSNDKRRLMKASTSNKKMKFSK